MGWIDEVGQRATVQEAASAVGMKRVRGNSLTPCPACGADQRGSADRRGPIGVRRDDKGWKCFKCEASGDALELATLRWTGQRLRDLNPDQRLQVRDRAAGLGWCAAPGMDAPAPPTVRLQGAQAARGAPAPAPGWSVRKLGAQAPAPVQPPPIGSGAMDWQPDLPQRCADQLWRPEGAQVLAYLQGRGFREETLRHWQVGAHLLRDRKSNQIVAQFVALPVLRADGQPVGMRFRTVPGPCLYCGGEGCKRCNDTGQVRKMYLRCQGQTSTLFGSSA